MATEERSASDIAFEQAKDDAVSAFGPKGAIFGSGFLAGFAITWIPLLLYVLLFIWSFLFSGSGAATAEERRAQAVADLLANWSNYASDAWLYAIVLGLFGILVAYLRALSCRIDWYLRFDFKQNEMRMGINEVLVGFGLPAIALVWLFLFGDPQAFFVMLIPILISGVVFNVLFRRFQNLFMRLLYRPSHEERLVMGLKVFIPRRVGSNHAQIDEIKLDKQNRMAEVLGHFDVEATEREVREIVSHYLRGYDPVHVRQVGERLPSVDEAG